MRKDAEGDTFWDSTWDAMELQKRADEREKRGKHFRNDERTPTLSPSPEREEEKRKKRTRSRSSSKSRSESPECDELQRLRKLKDIQELKVKDSEKYVAEPQDPKQFEYDSK